MKLHPSKVWFSRALLAACLMVVPALFGAAQSRGTGGRPPNQGPEPIPQEGPDILTSSKQRKAFLKHKLEKMKEDADEMAELAISVQEELEKTSENEFPLKVVEKAEKIEKLAKRIKNAAKGY